MKRLVLAGACALAAMTGAAAPASADFPYRPAGGDPLDFSAYRVSLGVAPDDIKGDDNDWKLASTSESGTNSASARELFGVRGAHVVDDNNVRSAWMTTTGRPDVTIAVLDSGIKWDDHNAMHDLRLKVRLNRGELPVPQTTGPTRDATVAASCPLGTPNPNDAHDVNGDGIFNLTDYACDPRVTLTGTPRVGDAGYMTPQDVIIAFSQGSFHGDGDGNGYVDDIAGWDFLDDDNDAYDDVQYGHGTGEALDSVAEADNGTKPIFNPANPPPPSTAGPCPNCMFIPLRVGDSFVADVNRFALASIYAVDNDVLVIQEALGTLNNSSLARHAIDYAYEHGVVVMASAADEAAQHHNWPSTYPRTIVTNSVVKYSQEFTPTQKSYLHFNGCTNFSSKLSIAIPSDSCSSNAVGLASGMAGLIYSAALNAKEAGDLDPSPSSKCRRPGGGECLITPGEVKQLMASGRISPGNANSNAPETEPQADDVDFVGAAEPACGVAPAANCTDPNRFFPPANDPATGRQVMAVTSPFATRSYGAHDGFDQYYGYGRVNMVKGVEATDAARIPPEVEITSPEWYAQIDPASPNLNVEGFVSARGSGYKCKVEVAPGSDPTNDADFQAVASAWCDNQTTHTAEHSGVLAQLNLSALKTRFPAGTDFTGRAPTATENSSTDGPHQNNRPHREPHGFTVRIVATSVQGPVTLTGEDRRNVYLHRDARLKQGFPREFPSDGASSPALVDLDGDNRNEMVFGSSDGRVHALKAGGGEADGFPVHTDPLPLHPGSRGISSGAIPESASLGAILSSPAVGDIDQDGAPEVVVADLEGKLYVWSAKGELVWKREANPAYSGKPLEPFKNVRCGKRCRTQHGFIASPVLANIDGSDDRRLDVIAAGMDRHVYAWRANGDGVPGFPVLVIDRNQITAIDPQTHVPTFKGGLGPALNQGAIVDTPAVGDLTGDGKLEIVVGTNEEYHSGLKDEDDPSQGFNDGGTNAGFSSNTLASLSVFAGPAGVLDPANSRLYAIKSTGDPNGGTSLANSDVFIAGWPKKIAVLLSELLPVVGEGVTGSPVIGDVTCATAGPGNKVAAIPGVGPGYVFNPDGTSCYGQEEGFDGEQHDRTLAADGAGFSAQGPKYDSPVIPAVGHPAFGRMDPAGATVTLLAPGAGVIRALDAAFPDYQGGQDFTIAWNPNTGQFSPGWPVPVNDLQFLTGPSVADVDGSPGEEAVGGTATMDLNALDAAGQPVAGFPKLTSDWMVTNPVIGSFGTLDTDENAHNVVGAMTRRGTLFVYDTPAPACPLGSWPRFHHDNANSGLLERDAVSPGTVTGAKVLGSALTFKAPGDDLLCDGVDHYEVVTSDVAIRGTDFGDAKEIEPDPVAEPGANQTLQLDIALNRYVAVRAVDDAGNVGRFALVDRSPPGGVPGGGGNGGNNGGGAGAGGGGAGSGSGSGAGCKADRRAPRSSISRRALHASGRRFSVRGHARDRGCARLRRVYVQISRRARGGKCRFVTRSGRLSHRRSCRRPHSIRAKGLRRWSLRIKRRLPAGRYRLVVRGLDRKGNREGTRRGNTLRFRVRPRT
jgi:hypothetical protein